MLVELALKERIGVTAESAGWRQRGRLLERLAASGVLRLEAGRGASATEAMEADLSGVHWMIPAARAGSA